MSRLVKKLALETGYQTGYYLAPPEFLNLVITFKCNFQCLSCSIWQKKNFPELSKDEWLNLAEDLKQNFNPQTYIEINGGEPLLRPELLFDLIKNLKEHFSFVALNSNGSLITSAAIQKLENAGLDLIKISFYSLDKNIHNEIRGADLAYDRALQAIELISQSKIKLEVAILLTNKNIETTPGLIKYLQTIPQTGITLQPLDESVESAESKNNQTTKIITSLWPERSASEKFFAWLLAHENNRRGIKQTLANLRAIKEYYLNPSTVAKYRCFAGQRNLVVYPDGEVSSCSRRRLIGNIKNEKIKNILKRADQERRAIKNCAKYCRIVGCNFSRGLKEVLRDIIK